MAIDTFTIKFNEYELETILAALEDYQNYDDEGMDPEDLIEELQFLQDAIQSKIRSAMPLQTEALTLIRQLFKRLPYLFIFQEDVKNANYPNLQR